MPIIRSRDLRHAGGSRREVDALLQQPNIVRVRAGWYASAGTPENVIAAVRCGGALSCRGALREHGIWAISGASHARVDPKGRVHRRDRRIHHAPGHAVAGVDDLPTAIRIALSCMPFEEVVCAADSILNSNAMTWSQLEQAMASPGGRAVMAVVDGTSESGLETLGRLRLRSRGVSVRTQVKIEGVGRVDLLIGDRLVLEFDGDAWHSTPQQREKDRRRDSALVALGYVVMRAGYPRVIDDWPAFEREVMAVVRRREHRWRAVHRVGHSASARTQTS